MSPAKKAVKAAAGLVLCLLLCGCGEPAVPDKADAVSHWNQAACLYNELAEEANSSGWSNDDSLYSSFDAAKVLLMQCREQILGVSADEELTVACVLLDEAAELLSPCRETLLLPYDSAEQELYRSAVAARALYEELCTLITENGWDYDADTIAMMDSAAQTLTDAARILSAEEPPDAGTTAPLLHALQDFLSRADAYRTAFSSPY